MSTPIYYEEIEASYGEDSAWLLIATDASGVSAYTGESKFCYFCHPDHFTEEFGIGPFLFSVGLEYQSDLEQGLISEELRLAFANNGISLSSTQNEISIIKESQSGNWQIRTHRQGCYYVTRQEVLDIYLFWGLVDGLSAPLLTRDQASGFVERGNYQPLMVVPIETMRSLCESGELAEVLPDSVFPGYRS